MKRTEPDHEQCRLGHHTWVAFFFGSGRLAYWECECCGKTDREIDKLPERLDWFNGWNKFPPRLIARGSSPPASIRRWITTDGMILTEGDPSSIHFVGLAIPDLAEAHSYVMCDENGKTKEVFEPIRERPCQYGDHYWLIRYQVIGTELLQFESHCYEESTYDTPYANEPKQKVILTGLKPFSDKLQNI